MNRIFNSNKIAGFLIIIQCLIFGFSFVVLQKLIDLKCPPFFIISIRFLIGAIFLLFVKIFTTKKDEKSCYSINKNILLGIKCGIMMFVSFSLQTYGAMYTSSAHNALFTGMYVIFIPIILLIWKRVFSYKTIIFSLLSFIGVFLVSNVTIKNFSFNVGDLLSIICGLAFSFHFIILERITPKVDFIIFTMFQLLSVAIISGIVSLIFEFDSYSCIELKGAIGWLIFLGVISTGITYLIQTYSQSKLSVNTVSVISCSESFFAVVFSITLGYDEFSIRLLIGCMLIIVSMIMISIKNNKI